MNSPVVVTLLLSMSRLTSSSLTATTPGSVEEICHTDIFHANCARNEVVIVDSAQYGRLEQGRCVSEDFVYLSCLRDVMPEVEALCSARHNCSLRVDDKAFKRTAPCHRDLKSHLMVAYHCRRVFVPTRVCLYSSETFLSGTYGLVSSQVSEETGCGTTDLNHPWVIQLGAGQRINITLHDFSMEATLAPTSRSGLLTSSGGGASASRDGGGGTKTCRVYATLREKASAQSTTICGGQGRVVNVFTSATNKVEMRILSAMTQQAQFLFVYHAIGCEDPPMSDGTVMERVVDTVSIGCRGSSSSGRSTMKCVGNQWQGSYENCSLGTTHADRTGLPLLPYTSSIVIIVIIAITVVCFILITGIFCIQWRLRKDQPARYPTTELGAPVSYDYSTPLGGGDPRGEKYHLPDHASSFSAGRGVSRRSQPDGSQCPPMDNTNEYASMRLMQIPAYSTDQGDSRGMPYPGYWGSYVADHIYESPESMQRGEERCGGYTPAHAACREGCAGERRYEGKDGGVEGRTLDHVTRGCGEMVVARPYETPAS